MVTIAVVLVFIGTVLGVMALLAILIPTPDPHAVRVQQIQAAAAGAVPLTADRRQGSVRAWVQQIAEQLGRRMPPQSPKAQAKGRNLLVQAGYRKASAGLAFQGVECCLRPCCP